MRIFIASGIFHPDSGGPATYLYRLLPELQQRGHSVQVVTFGEPSAKDQHYPYPLTRISLKQPLLRRRRAYLAAYRAAVATADMVYINSLGLPRAADKHLPRVLKVVGDLAWERSVNRGWIAPDTDIDAFQRSRKTPLVEYLKIARAWEVQHVDQVIVPSQYLQQMVTGWGAPPEWVQVIYNALDSDQYGPTLSQAEARAQLGIDPNTPILLTAARLTVWKGVDMLLDAVSALPGYRLIVAGDGPQQHTLETQAARLGLADRVQFLGKVTHERLALYMRAADYFTLYSGYEGLSHVILEALTAGTPVIASARGGNPELITDGVNGLLVAHPNVSALTEALKQAFDPRLKAQLRANVQQGLDRFVWDKLIAQTIQTLSTAADKSQ